MGTENEGLTPLFVEDIQDLVPFRCSADLATQLLKIPTAEEVRLTVASMPKNKVHGCWCRIPH